MRLDLRFGLVLAKFAGMGWNFAWIGLSDESGNLIEGV